MNAPTPFVVQIPDQALVDLEARLRHTRWVVDPHHGDWGPGPPPGFVHQLCHHWQHHFDWRAFEARINRQPQVRLEMDGLAIHAIHRPSSRPDAVPLILIHGWPGAFVEYLDLCDPLAEPLNGELLNGELLNGELLNGEPLNGEPVEGEPAFHVVVPSLPGYGFSTTRPGVNPQRIADHLVALMEGLGYQRFMVQGGNWGSLIGTEMARRWPERVMGLHLSSISGSAPQVAEGFPVEDHERSWITEPASFPHFALLTQKPASPAYALNDSPAGLAAWIGEKLHDWADNGGAGESGLGPQRMLEIIALYWFTGTIGSAMGLYREFIQGMPEERFVTVPTAVALFPRSIAKMPRSWARRLYQIQRWTVFDRGGHFPALETPELLLADIRAFARELALGG